MCTFARIGTIYFLLLAAPFHAQTVDVTESLPNAIANGHVIVGFRSTGASSGDSILLTIAKTSTAPSGRMIITILPGLRLNNVSQTGQSMVLAGVRGRASGPSSFTPANAIVLTGPEANTYILSAYCAEFHKDNPAPSSTFALGLVDAKLGCILLTAGRNNLSVEATQAAVWRYTDNVSLQDVNRKFAVTESDWTAAQAVANSCLPQGEQIGVGTESPTAPHLESGAQAARLPPKAWSKSFDVGAGILYVSPGRLRYEQELDKKGKPVNKWQPSFNVSCSEISEWKADSGNWIWKVPPNSGPSWWNFHIKLKNGKKYHLGAWPAESDMKAILTTISDACGVR